MAEQCVMGDVLGLSAFTMNENCSKLSKGIN